MSNGEQESGSEEPDIPRFIPAILRVFTNSQANERLPARTKQSFKSLDRGLKAFLRSSNLPGLEYRLRLAGYNSLSDLLDADVDALCAHGFTPLMARRLLRALDDYIVRQLDRNDGVQIPFQLVRKGQKIKSDPTEKMKAMPTFGKRNIKRQRSQEMSKKRVNTPKGGKAIAPKRPISYVRLMSQDNLPSEPIFQHDVFSGVSNGDTEGGAVEEGGVRGVEEGSTIGGTERGEGTEEGGGRTEEEEEGRGVDEGGVFLTTAAEGVSAAAESDVRAREDVDPLPVRDGVPISARTVRFRHSVPVFQEFFVGDALDTGEHWLSADEMGKRARRCNSVPADFRFHNSNSTPLRSWCMLVRSYSCPSSLATPPSQIESTLTELCTSQELPVIVTTLESLASVVQHSEAQRREVREKGGTEVLVDLLITLCTHPRVVDSGFKLLKYLTRGDVVEGTMPVDTVSAVLQAMDCHPTSGRTLTQGCLVLGNIGRAAPSLCEQLLSDHALTTLAIHMATFPGDPILQVGAMSALAVGLGCWPEGRLHLLAEHGKLLDLVLVAMESFPEDEQVQEYACSFMALLTTEVAVEMESGVVQLIVEHVCIAMATHSRSSAVTVWAAKCLASSSSNAALGDSKLAGRCCDLLTEALSAFPADPQVWTWGLYALLQLLIRNSNVRGELVRGGVVSLLKTPPNDVPECGVQYLEQILTILTQS